MQDLAARSGTVLCEGTESLALLPLTAGVPAFEEALAHFDTVVAYKGGRRMPQVLEVLRAAGRLDGAVYGAALGLPGEQVGPRRRPARRGPVPVHRHRPGRGAHEQRVQAVTTGLVSFVGAGPGAADLLTLRAAQRIAEADIVIWAASLVHEDVLQHARPGAEVVNSAEHSVEGITHLYERAAREGLRVARIHSGDPALWGATQEQHELCTRLGLETEVVPGVSSFSAVAAIVQRELTIPEVAQSVVLTRLEGGKTPMPAGETVRGFAEHGTTMALFLSAARTKQLQDELLAAGTYDEDTPCVVAYAATWPDELVLECRLGDLAATVKEHKLYKHTMVLVGPALAAGGTRSHLYHPGHFHEHRRVESPEARAELKARDRALKAR